MMRLILEGFPLAIPPKLCTADQVGTAWNKQGMCFRFLLLICSCASLHLHPFHVCIICDVIRIVNICHAFHTLESCLLSRPIAYEQLFVCSANQGKILALQK